MKSANEDCETAYPEKRGRLVRKGGKTKKEGGGSEDSLLIDALDAFLRNVQKERLNMSQLHLLIIVYRVEECSIRLSEIAALIGFTCGGVTGLADQLVKRGLATRHVYPDDRRSVYLMLTDTGKELVRKVDQFLLESLASVLNR